jgi:TPR repeat protein
MIKGVLSVKRRPTGQVRWAISVCELILCFVSSIAPHIARAESDSCSKGYSNGSKQDVEACAALAGAGGPNAEFGYALILWSGNNRASDHKAALEWFRKSARQGHLLAQICLGKFLGHPDVEPELRNPVEAYAWWIAAGATKSAATLIATLSRTDSAVARRLGDDYKTRYSQTRPLPGGP